MIEDKGKGNPLGVSGPVSDPTLGSSSIFLQDVVPHSPFPSSLSGGLVVLDRSWEERNSEQCAQRFSTPHTPRQPGVTCRTGPTENSGFGDPTQPEDSLIGHF